MKEYYNYSTNEFINKAKFPIVIERDNITIFKKIAQIMVDTIKKNNEYDKKTVMVNPVGPTGQYPYFVEMVNEQKISLKNCWFINMDEYLTETDNWIDKEDQLSFRGFMDKTVYSKILPELNVPENQRFFPNPEKLNEIPRLLNELGKLDLVVGGIGITGHVAFNEPQPELTNEEFLDLSTRTLKITKETRATNACNDLHGAMEEMPWNAVTIGMKEIFSAKKIVLGCFRDWHRGVIRHATCGEPSSDFPVSLLQLHQDTMLYVSDKVADYNLN